MTITSTMHMATNNTAKNTRGMTNATVEQDSDDSISKQGREEGREGRRGREGGGRE